MFSRTERTFLQRLVEGRPESASSRLEQEFPNPTYRRKLMWGIRQKASRSLADWQLYVEAARRDPRLLPHGSEAGSSSPPVFEDPIVVFFEGIRQRLTARRPRPPSAHVPPVGRTR